MKRTRVSVIRVYRSPLDHSRGTLVAGNLRISCALGRSGTAYSKREGDGYTVIGRFGMIEAFYRADRIRRPQTGLKLKATRRTDGWCDAPDDRLYNRKVPLPHKASHEELWRDDGLYNVVVDLSVNRRPIVKGRGSALFLHMAKPGYSPTAGCIAVAAKDMARLLALAGPDTKIQIMG